MNSMTMSSQTLFDRMDRVDKIVAQKQMPIIHLGPSQADDGATTLQRAPLTGNDPCDESCHALMLRLTPPYSRCQTHYLGVHNEPVLPNACSSAKKFPITTTVHSVAGWLLGMPTVGRPLLDAGNGYAWPKVASHVASVTRSAYREISRRTMPALLACATKLPR